MFGFKKKKKLKVGYRPKYIDYYGNPHSVDDMSIRHLRNSVKGFRRKGYVPTWEYKKGINRPMAILDFLIIELRDRDDDRDRLRRTKKRGQFLG